MKRTKSTDQLNTRGAEIGQRMIEVKLYFLERQKLEGRD